MDNEFYRDFEVSNVTAPAIIDETATPLSTKVEDFVYSYTYFNNLPYPVTIGFRDGTMFTLLPREDRTKPQKLFIKKRVRFNSQAVALTLPDITTHEEHVKLHKTYSPENPNNRIEGSGYGHVKEVVEEYNITAEELARYPAMYIFNIDILVTIRSIKDVYHPFSPEGLYKSRLLKHYEDQSGYDTNNSRIFGMEIELIAESPSKQGSKYINLSGVIFRVPIRYTCEKKPGLYVRYHGLTTRERTASPPETKYFEWKDRDKFPFIIFDTYLDAENYGDINTQRKIELENLKHQNEILQQEVKEKEHTRKMNEIDRKEVSEIVKWIPTIIAGVISIATVIIGIAQKSMKT